MLCNWKKYNNFITEGRLLIAYRLVKLLKGCRAWPYFLKFPIKYLSLFIFTSSFIIVFKSYMKSFYTLETFYFLYDEIFFQVTLPPVLYFEKLLNIVLHKGFVLANFNQWSWTSISRNQFNYFGDFCISKGWCPYRQTPDHSKNYSSLYFYRM